MKVTIQLDDDAYAQYKKQSKTRDDAGAREEIKARLVLFKDCSRDERHLLLVGDDRREVERLVQTTVETPERLIREIANLCTYRIGLVERTFTAEELIRIHAQAEFHGMAPEDYIKMTVEEIANQFMLTV